MSAAEALAPEQSVDEVREGLSVTEKGQPANTIGNCRTVFCHDPLLRDAIRLNLLTDRVDIVRDLGWRRNTSALTDTDVKYLLLYFEQNYGLTSEKKMTAALSIVANENCYHPIQDVLNGLVWDGTPRIRSCLHHFLGAEVSDYVEEMLKHFLLGAIRRVFSPGSKYEEMLCLVGGQGAGKSSFFRLLAIRDEWFSDDLKKLDDDRVFLKLQGHWIIEMSEMLATSSAKQCEPGQRGNVAAPQPIPRIRRTTRRGTPPTGAHGVRALQRIFHAPAHQHARRPQARAHGVGRRTPRYINRVLHRQHRAAAAQKLRDKPHAHRDHERNHRRGVA